MGWRPTLRLVAHKATRSCVRSPAFRKRCFGPLHNRASEARRPDGVLADIDSVRIHEAIEYDFAGHFGDPVGSLAVRAAEIDRALRDWLERHPDGCVVSLGEGLETQVRRVDNGRVRWLSVDYPTLSGYGSASSLQLTGSVILP